MPTSRNVTSSQLIIYVFLGIVAIGIFALLGIMIAVGLQKYRETYTVVEPPPKVVSIPEYFGYTEETDCENFIRYLAKAKEENSDFIDLDARGKYDSIEDAYNQCGEYLNKDQRYEYGVRKKKTKEMEAKEADEEEKVYAKDEFDARDYVEKLTGFSYAGWKTGDPTPITKSTKYRF